MRRSGYQIADEPKPGALEHLAVDPLWPFLAIMFGGAWLSWPWFIVNSFAVGSPSRGRELAIAIGGFIASAGALFAVLYSVGVGWLPRAGVPYAILVVIVVKLAVTYWLHVLQTSTFSIYTYYGGVVRSGALVLMGGALLSFTLGPKLLEQAPFVYMWLQ